MPCKNVKIIIKKKIIKKEKKFTRLLDALTINK